MRYCIQCLINVLGGLPLCYPLPSPSHLLLRGQASTDNLLVTYQHCPALLVDVCVMDLSACYCHSSLVAQHCCKGDAGYRAWLLSVYYAMWYAVFSRHTDLLSADTGVRIIHSLQIFTLWHKSKVGVRIIFDGVLYSKFYGTFAYNFGRYWQIFEIFSLLNLSRNLQQVVVALPITP